MTPFNDNAVFFFFLTFLSFGHIHSCVGHWEYFYSYPGTNL